MALIEELKKNSVQFRTSGANWTHGMVNICCPSCGESRFHCGIHENDLWWHCFVCGASGKWPSMKSLLTRAYPGSTWTSVGQSISFIDIEPPEKKAPSEALYVDGRTEVLNLWLSRWPAYREKDFPDRPRGLCLEELDDIEIYDGIGKLRGYAVFKEGEEINARKYISGGSGPRWWRQSINKDYVFLGEACRKLSSNTGVIVEGIFDCLRFPHGSCVAILGSTILAKLVNTLPEIFKGREKILLALDRDAKPRVIETLYFNLTDLGYEVHTLDWSRLPPDVKDIDELYIFYQAIFQKEVIDRYGISVEVENLFD